MARRSLLVLVTLSAACFSDPSSVTNDGGADTDTGRDDGASEGADDDGNEGDATTAPATDDDGSTTTGGETGGDGAYPPDVLDHLDLPYPPDDYDPALPAHFGSDTVLGFDNVPDSNPITDEGATLGRVLFYDVALSKTDTVACASCHRQALGFADDAALSEGFDGGHTGRNSMGLANARFYAGDRFFWDERAASVEDQVLMPIQDAVEMGLTLDELVTKVAAQPYYPELFARAYGDPEVTPERIQLALAQFVRAIMSYRSPFDEGIAQAGSILDPFPTFSAAENMGKQLFLSPVGNCAPCHLGNEGPPPMMGVPPGNQAIFQLTAPANNGLDATTVDDQGAGMGRFKSPSLRNVELTAPYMHDGRFDTLEQVIDHYDSGVQPHPGLDPRLMVGGEPQQLGLDAAQKAALVAFLRTLTDDELLDDPKFADPFVR